MKCVVFVTMLLAVGVALAEEPTATQQISDLLASAQKNLQEYTKNFPSSTELVNTVKNQTETFASNVNTYIQQTSEDIKKKAPELEKVWNEAKTKLNKVVEDINANVPNAKESAEQLQKQFEEGVQTLVKETTTITETFQKNSGNVKEEISTFTKKAIDIAVSAVQTMNDKLKQVAETGKKN